MVTVTNERILAKELKKENTAGRFVLVGEEANSNIEAEIIQVGKGALTKTGVLIPPSVKVGDHVLLMPGAGITIKVNGEEMLVFKDEDIIAITDNDNDND